MHTSPETLALLALGEQDALVGQREHLQRCPVCAAELQDLTEVVQRARQVTPEDTLHQPPPRVWDRIQAEIRATGLEEPVRRVSHGSHRDGVASVKATLLTQDPLPAPASGRAAGSHRRRSLRAGAFGLAAAVLAAVAFGLGLNWNRLTQSSDYAATPIHLNALPPFPGADGSAAVEKEASGARVLVVHVTVPQNLPGRREVWMSDVNALHMRPMGYLDQGSGRFPIPPDVNLQSFPVVDVSEEPAHDTNPEHSGISVVRGRFAQ